MSFNIYEEVTARIISELEKGVIPWEKPWTGTKDGAISYSTGKPYSLINQMLLGDPGEYITFSQCKAKGGKVRAGAKSKMVVFWKMVPVKDETAENGERLVPMLRYYNVFHLSDCEGVTSRICDEKPAADPQRDETAETVIADYLTRSGVKLSHLAQDKAYYNPIKDAIVVPLLEQFPKQSEYYSTVFHELAHSTGHASRLNRIKATAFSSDTEYSKEELVAEISAAACCTRLHLETPSSFKNSAAYIQSWLRALRNDNKLIVSAAGRAEKATRMIFNETISA